RELCAIDTSTDGGSALNAETDVATSPHGRPSLRRPVTTATPAASPAIASTNSSGTPFSTAADPSPALGVTPSGSDPAVLVPRGVRPLKTTALGVRPRGTRPPRGQTPSKRRPDGHDVGAERNGRQRQPAAAAERRERQRPDRVPRHQPGGGREQREHGPAG